MLHGSLSDPRITWIIQPDGTRMDLAWPPGYSARFTPDLEVLDDRTSDVAREGSLATGGCLTAEPGIHSVDFTALGPEVTEPQMTAEP